MPPKRSASWGRRAELESLGGKAVLVGPSWDRVCWVGSSLGFLHLGAMGAFALGAPAVEVMGWPLAHSLLVAFRITDSVAELTNPEIHLHMDTHVAFVCCLL